MTERISKTFWLTASLTHLLLVTLSASYIGLPEFLPGKRIIDIYRKASGADGTYGFFAPFIWGKTRFTFDVIDEHGQKSQGLSLFDRPRREAEIRVGNLSEELMRDNPEHREFRQKLGASMAASVFSSHPDATEVVLRVDEYWPNTMEEYRQGKREAWSEAYRARFSKRKADNQGVLP